LAEYHRVDAATIPAVTISAIALTIQTRRISRRTPTK
jgi:hypothetical protein